MLFLAKNSCSSNQASFNFVDDQGMISTQLLLNKISNIAKNPVDGLMNFFILIKLLAQEYQKYK